MQQYFKYLILLLIVWPGLSTHLSAQTEVSPVHLRLMARNYGDSVVLRWAFSNPEAWRYLNSRGYWIERFELDNATNQPIGSEFKQLSATPIKPWTKEEFLQRVTPRDTFTMIVGQCLYGEDKLPTGVENNLFRALELQAQSDENRLLFAMLTADRSPAAANAMGLRWVDRHIQAGRKYIYRLRVEDDPAFPFRTDSSLYVIATDQQFETDIPFAPEIIPGDSMVTLQWTRSSVFTAYYIEKSLDQGKSWVRLNKDPFLNLVSPGTADPDKVYFNDRVGANYVPYQYRLRGTTLFGEVSKPSEPVEGMGVDLTPTVAPVYKSAENTTGTRVELQWEMAMAADLKGFRVCHSGTVEGPWTPVHEGLLPVEARFFAHEKADEFGTNYYRIYAVDQHDNASGCYPILVKMNNQNPPAMPVWAKCTIDTSGIVTLNWKRGTEPDLWGYQIYSNNQRDHVFIVITSDLVTDTTYSFQIPLDNLTEKMFFRIRAVDYSYALSPYSEILELKKPDKIPPTKPAFNDYLATETGIQLGWALSSSSDVVKQILQRRLKGEAWITLAELEKGVQQYTDAAVKPGQRYQYSIIAVDDAGLQSERSFGLAVQAKVIHQRPEPIHLTAEILPEKAGVQLKWQYASPDNNYYFEVYQVLANNSLRLLGTVDNPQTVFVDKRPAAEFGSQYGVKAFHKDGGSSPVIKTQLTQ